MMKATTLLALLALAAACSPAVYADASAQGSAAAPQLTLDPTLYAEALREVQGLPQTSPSAAGEAAPTAPSAKETPLPAVDSPVEQPGGSASPELSSAPGVEDWQAAMRDAGTELADVRLLVLLQRLNPLDPPSARAEDYAAVLRLHHLMLAGNARACLELARACRAGQFENGLLFIESEALASVLERRAAAFHLPLHASPPALPSAAAPAAGR